MKYLRNALIIILLAAMALTGLAPTALAFDSPQTDASDAPAQEETADELSPATQESETGTSETPTQQTQTPETQTSETETTGETQTTSETETAGETSQTTQESETAQTDTQQTQTDEAEIPALDSGALSWQEPGNTTAEILDGGTFLAADGVCYYSDGGIWRNAGDGDSYLCADDARNLNLADGWLYYTAQGSVRRIPASGGSAETVYAFGSYIKQMYVIGAQLRFLSDGKAYSYNTADAVVTQLEAPDALMALLPTRYGNLYLTGSVCDYTLYCESERLMSGVKSAYTDGEYLVVVDDSGTRQASLSEIFGGVFSLSAYSLHRQDEAAAANGLSDEEQLQNEAAFLESAAYEELQEQIRNAGDGANYYCATNPDIAYLASTSGLTTTQQNIVMRARQMAEVLWTPLYWRYSWGGNDVTYRNANANSSAKVEATDGSYEVGWFDAGKTYQGIPYAQAVYTGYVGWNLSITEFVNAVNNSGSSFYSGYSTYSRTAPYYGSDCSGFVSWAWNLPGRCTCTSLVTYGYSTYIGTSLSKLQVGDALNNTNAHVTLVTDIAYNSNGEIVSVEITEQTPCKMRVTCYGELIPGKTYHYTGTLSRLKTYYLNGGYVIYRRDCSRSVTYTPSTAVPLEQDGWIGAPTVSAATAADGASMAVTLTGKNNAAVYYTLDGTAPTTSSARYNGPILLTESKTVKAICDPGEDYTGSFVLTYKVTVSKAAAPQLSVVDGYLSGSVVSQGAHVSLFADSGASIYYTLDGSVPTTNSTLMTAAGVEITGPVTLRAVAKTSGKINSDPVTYSLTIGDFIVIDVGDCAGGYLSPSGEIGVLKGGSLTVTATANDNYALSGLIVDGESVGAKTSYTLENITQPHTVAAVFVLSLPFTDVSASSWYAEQVAFVYSKNLFSGTSSTKFSPNAAMTRGMFITVLGRLQGVSSTLAKWTGTLGVTNGTLINVRSSASTGSSAVTQIANSGTYVKVTGTATGSDGCTWYKISYNGYSGYVRSRLGAVGTKTLLYVYDGAFTDLGSDYYTGYCQWAYMNDLISGVTDTSLCPTRSISRQDICVLIYRYLTKYKGMTLKTSSNKFEDDASIASYARTAVYAMRQIGIVSGDPNGDFRPTGSASRADVATIFRNLYNYLNG